MIAAMLPVYLFLIFSLPVLITAAPIVFVQNNWFKLSLIALSPATYAISYLLVAGLLSMPWQKAIFPGVFPRDLKHRIYGPRRMYGICWTSIYYFTPLYYIYLSTPPLKRLMFRLFGYKFNMDFTIYPDTWLRDLTCVYFGEGAYLANKSTVGTNICLMDGSLIVDRVKLDVKSMLGHGAVVGPGTKFRKYVETSIDNVFGMRVLVNDRTKIGGKVGISHGALFGENCDIGHHCYIGTQANISDNIKLHAGSNIPASAHVRTQSEADNYYSSETKLLNDFRNELLSNAAAKELSGLRRGGGSKSGQETA